MIWFGLVWFGIMAYQPLLYKTNPLYTYIYIRYI